MPENLVTIPVVVPASLAAKIREAAASVAPGKKGKLKLNLDSYGNLTASIGTRLNNHVTVAAFAERSASGGKPQAGAEVTIEWESEP